MKELLPSRFPFTRHFKSMLGLGDKFFNHYVLPFLTEPAMKSRLAYNVMIKTSLDEEETKLLFQDNLSKRGHEELEWIMTFPWVLPENEKNKALRNKYFFSAIARPFKQYFCLVYKDGNLIAIVMITLKNKQLKVPYFHSSDFDLALIADLLFTEAWKNGMSYIDVFDEELVREMQLKSAFYAYSRAQERKYMVSSKIIGDLPLAASSRLSDGEGDVVFV